ncbi:leucine--tRNA ligase [Ferruginibacter sp. SUN106]|uniref:leucine--tRNA ligase n=1 Tax=Ferruginibacter sp. SUN106 TaxID=2978348 RepID=UPI003D362B04
MEYKFNEIEKKWQDHWKENKVYKVSNDTDKPKYYVLDMFPYPSGAGLHVGHPLGYIASDIYSRYKRLKGFNVLHPMGFDSFGLPAEQYALETGQHPAETTKKNIATFKNQLDKIGFCYDWEREVQTSDPNYYKWTQWIFLQLFNSYFCNTQKKARPITELVKKYETKGCAKFTAEEWNSYSKKEQEEILMDRRLAFSKYGEVNWCEALGTVLANDEVVNGVSERGGHPVVKKKMRQWYLRITSYADRLLEGLETVDFSESMKEMQRNWIGKSQGAEIIFEVVSSESSVVSTPLTSPVSRLTVYTTRPDTIFGVDFMVVAPELDLVQQIKTPEQTAAVDEYIAYVKSRSDVDRMAEKKITGCFTGAYAINPFDGKQIPIWISEYVLAGYGTGAIMAVPCGDERDFKFAKHFNIPITNIIGTHFNGEEANATKEALLENSGFLNGVKMTEATEIVLQKLEEKGIGKRKVNYRMRDAGFSRQRYWGEPFPVIWSDGIAVPLDAAELPLELPHVDKYGPGREGEGPLSNLVDWVSVSSNKPSGVSGKRETSTMPGYAGSSWYFLRYMDPHNAETFCDRKASDYWNQVDLYIGGTEHAVGHLLYSRLWTKVLFDLGHIGYDEPFKRLLNQGMIQGSSRFMYRVEEFIYGKGGSINYASGKKIFISKNIYDKVVKPVHENDKNLAQEKIAEILEIGDFDTIQVQSILLNSIHVDVNIVDGLELDLNAVRKWRSEFEDAKFVLEDGKYICGVETEKMSKRYFNTVNPSDLCDSYGADTFRMYEMFLGPVEASKPWDTKGIEGVHRFLRKLWRLFNDELKGKVWTDEKATDAELKILHRTIKKIEEDTEKFSFNTAVSAFMICVNDLFDAKCYKKEVLEKILILLVPYAPHIAEELWHQLGNAGTVLDAAYPTFNPALLVESSKEYPVSINGKVRTNLSLALDLDQKQVEEIILQNETVQKWLEGKPPKKVIYVKNKMINVVV